jgi:hypothetical protein
MSIITSGERLTMTQNLKGGRPPKPARLRRTQRLQLMLTAAEHKALNKYAGQRNLTASEIIRGLLRSLIEEQAMDTVKKGGRS